jgi:hypothetical protein
MPRAIKKARGARRVRAPTLPRVFLTALPESVAALVVSPRGGWAAAADADGGITLVCATGE